MDPLDRVIGRAAVDRAFRALLLQWPAAALAEEQLPEALRGLLEPIRADDLDEFAAVARRRYRRPQHSL